MIQSLNKSEFLQILAKIEEQNCVEERRIKYVNFDFDNRTKTFWKVVFRCWGKKYLFTTVNRTEDGDLYTEIMHWLEGKCEKNPIE